MKSKENGKNYRKFKIVVSITDSEKQQEIDQLREMGVEPQNENYATDTMSRDIYIDLDEISAFWTHYEPDPMDPNASAIDGEDPSHQVPMTNIYGTNTGFEAADGAMTLYNITDKQIAEALGLDNDELDKELEELYKENDQ